MATATLVVIAIAVVIVFAAVILGLAIALRRSSPAAAPSFDSFSPASSVTPTPISSEPLGSSGDFMMTIADIFFIKGRGVVVTGRVDQGSITTGQRVRIGEVGGPAVEAQVTAIETFRKQVPTATQGDNIGLLLRDVTRDQLRQGMIITTL